MVDFKDWRQQLMVSMVHAMQARLINVSTVDTI
jgi:hypothetical protein